MNRLLYAGILSGVVLSIAGIILLGTDNTICLSIFIILIGLLFLFFQTGPAAASSSKGGPPTQMISNTVVNLDSRTRWRGKSIEEEKLGLLILIAGSVAAAISLIIFYLI